MAVMQGSILVLEKYIRVFRADSVLYLQMVQKDTNENGQKKSDEAIVAKCQQLKNPNEERLEFFTLYFKIFCWFKRYKK